MKIKLFHIFLFLISILIFPSCKQETATPIDLSYDYYPLNTGHWVTYEVDSTYYNDFNDSIETYHYYIKELIESTFLDNQSRPTQRIQRFKRLDSVWHISDIWASNITSTMAEKVEENIRFVKLVFPIVDEKAWNGNALNILGENEYKYINVFQPFTINGITFDSTVTVIQAKDTGLYVKNQEEVFAKNVGLICKHYKDVKTLFPFNPDSIVQGKDYTYKIIDYGN